MKQRPETKKLSIKRELVFAPCYFFTGLWILFTVFMLAWILGASLSTSKEIYSGTVFKFESGLNFKNYIDAWKTQNVSLFFSNSLLYATISCIATIMIASPAAYVLARFKFFASGLIKYLFVLGMSVPIIMVILPLFGLTTQLPFGKTRGLIILLYTFMNVPFTTTFLINFFESLSKTYEEAASIDGCGPIKTFYRIMLPLTQPGLITISIFLFLTVWNEYFIALVFASSDRLKNVGIGLASMVSALKYIGNLGGVFAAVVIVFLPTFILYIFLSNKIIAGVTGGGIKG